MTDQQVDPSELLLCQRCVLPENFPGANIRYGLCSYCAASSDIESLRQVKMDLAAKIEGIIESHRGSAGYDCVVAFSGGKDSTYTLKLLVEKYQLKCLAITIDNGFISGQAEKNCKTVTTALGVDFIFYTPNFDFMRNMYVKSAAGNNIHTKSAIKRASSMCNSCIQLINNYMLKTAVQQQIPMIAGGYIGGQVPHDAAVLKMDLNRQKKLRASALDKAVSNFGPNAERYFGVDINESDTANNIITIINPMLSVDLSEEEIIDEIANIGWQAVSDTGLNSSNCRLNDVGISMHFKKHGFHPYAFEISEQIRAGLISREAALSKVKKIPTLEQLKPQILKLGLSDETLQAIEIK